MKSWKGVMIGMGIALAVLIGFAIGHHWPNKGPEEPIGTKVDTLFVCDTVVVSKPVSVTRTVVEKELIPVTDTVRVNDTLFIALDGEQIRWEDSLSVVYASGINPQIDSVIHHVRNMVIHEEIPVVQVRKTRWGIGLQAGYGIGKEGLTPWVGIGVSYNILTW